MIATNKSSGSFWSRARKYRYRTVLIIAVFWTLIDVFMTLVTDLSHLRPLNNLLWRVFFVFGMSLIMGYLFVFTLKKMFRNFPLWINFLLKSLILLLSAFFMNFLVHFIENKFILGISISASVHKFAYEAISGQWLLEKTIYWLVLFLFTQLYIEINEKYSPGVFLDIILGKYFVPKVENRIVMFIDLKDSTPTAERMGHQQYFLFIREFIYDVSLAIIEHNGRIYQYVGDEIVVSWFLSKKNISNCLKAVIESRKNLQRKSEFYRRNYNTVPEFRVGIHIGEVTVGEIGVIKKDLAMSGDTMNTTARIRSACNELNQKFVVSAEFIKHSDLAEFQRESLGNVDLKGKTEEIELYALKI
ncbi:MAG: adenylate/guanylate cyclase domain-containing protein [Ferruginibacter sp.]